MVSSFVRFVLGIVLVALLVACPAAPVGGVQSVAIVGGDRTVVVGASVALEVEVATSGGASGAVDWSSDAPGVVAVDASSGEAEALAVGTATISATSVADPSKSDAIDVTVDPAGVLRWTRQFGTAFNDLASAIAVGADGRVYVAGQTFGALEGANAGGLDAFVRAYDADGALRWTRQFGTSALDLASGVAVDPMGRVYVAGITSGALEGVNAGGQDAFVRSYDADGVLRWTRQFGTSSSEFFSCVAVDTAGRVYVSGSTPDALEGPSFGQSDAFLRSFDADGAVRWTRQFGTTLTDVASCVAVDAEGHPYVVGYTNGAFPGEVSSGGSDAFVRSFDADGNVRWTRQFGSPSNDQAAGVAVDGAGRVVVVGYADGVLEGASAGSRDAFVRSYDADGVVRWTRQFGSSASDQARAVAIDVSGAVAVVGSTEGSIGGPNAGDADAFVRTFDAEGAVRWTRQFGTASEDALGDVAVDAAGRLYASGFSDGALVGVSEGERDAILVSYGP